MKILEMLFGCRHKRLSFPISNRRGQRRPPIACQTGAYVVCLDCGREFAYDWDRMHIVSAHNEPEATPTSLEAKAS